MDFIFHLRLVLYRQQKNVDTHTPPQNSSHTRTLQVWPWGLADRLVQGIASLVSAVRSAALAARHTSYPATGSRTSREALDELERLEAAEAARAGDFG